MQNKCIGALLAWIYYGKAATYEQARILLQTPQPHALLLIAKLSTLAFYAGCLFLVWRHRLEQDRVGRTVFLAVFALAIAVISPVSWRNGYAVCLILFILLWVDVLRASTHGVRLWLLTLTTFGIGTLFFDLAAQVAAPPALKILFAATWTVSSALLCLEVLRNGVSRAWLKPRRGKGTSLESLDEHALN